MIPSTYVAALVDRIAWERKAHSGLSECGEVDKSFLSYFRLKVGRHHERDANHLNNEKRETANYLDQNAPVPPYPFFFRMILHAYIIKFCYTFDHTSTILQAWVGSMLLYWIIIVMVSSASSVVVRHRELLHNLSLERGMIDRVMKSVRTPRRRSRSGLCWLRQLSFCILTRLHGDKMKAMFLLSSPRETSGPTRRRWKWNHFTLGHACVAASADMSMKYTLWRILCLRKYPACLWRI